MNEKPKIIEFEVIADFPCSMHQKGEIIRVYETSGTAYVVEMIDGYDNSQSEKVDLRDYPDIYRQLSENKTDQSK